jgi:hypothetical protein
MFYGVLFPVCSQTRSEELKEHTPKIKNKKSSDSEDGLRICHFKKKLFDSASACLTVNPLSGGAANYY